LISGQRNSLSVFDQPKALWGTRAGLVTGQRLRPFGTAEALAHADAERPRTLHPDEALPRRRERGPQVGRQSVQDRAGQVDEDRKLQWTT
jgi:hypothetical protein